MTSFKLKAKILGYFLKYGTVVSVFVLSLLSLCLLCNVSLLITLTAELLFGLVIAAILFILSILYNSCIVLKFSIIYNWVMYNCIILQSKNMFEALDINVNYARCFMFVVGVIILILCIFKYLKTKLK